MDYEAMWSSTTTTTTTTALCVHVMYVYTAACTAEGIVGESTAPFRTDIDEISPAVASRIQYVRSR